MFWQLVRIKTLAISQKIIQFLQMLQQFFLPCTQCHIAEQVSFYRSGIKQFFAFKKSAGKITVTPVLFKSGVFNFQQVHHSFGINPFETTDKNKGWDCLYKTQPADTGAYVYVLQYKDNKRQQSLRGSFLLLR